MLDAIMYTVIGVVLVIILLRFSFACYSNYLDLTAVKVDRIKAKVVDKTGNEVIICDCRKYGRFSIANEGLFVAVYVDDYINVYRDNVGHYIYRVPTSGWWC